MRFKSARQRKAVMSKVTLKKINSLKWKRPNNQPVAVYSGNHFIGYFNIATFKRKNMR